MKIIFFVLKFMAIPVVVCARWIIFKIFLYLDMPICLLRMGFSKSLTAHILSLLAFFYALLLGVLYFKLVVYFDKTLCLRK
ncbi:MAG: hypothetical protein IJI37_07555 [Opitutales bacterium]|nr:hypothetical protein [Opitutales bacterium]